MRHEQDKRIVKRGHQICVVSCRTFGAPYFEELEEVEVHRVPAITLPVLEYPLPNLLLLYSWVVLLIRRYKISLIHVEDGAFLTSLLVPLVKKALKKPVILSMQGFPGFSWFYGNHLVDLVAKLYTLTLCKTVLRSADRVVLSATVYVKDALNLGASPDRISVIPRGVDTETFFPDPSRRSQMRRKLNLKDDEKMILFAGRLVPVKGLEYFLEAARVLIRNHSKIVFMVAGDGVLRGKYERETRSLRSAVEFIGYRHDMPDVMNAADIFVLSSTSEGFPNAVLEASACAKPVISTRVGGASDIILNGETGVLVEPGDVEELCGALEEVLADLHQTMMGDKALRRVRKYFSWDSVIPKWERMYSEVMNSVYLGSS